ncbi:TPA: helix-turn-helix domain-containing protein, partial [Pseudomonas aeruginosa]|nr:helix-turn-helix domain-containing protein [Pseudomonas aeruginosa]
PRTVIEPTREPSGNLLPADSGQPDAERDRQQACRAIWSAYAAAYHHRYGTHPVRNSKVNGQVRDLLKRLGAEEAPAVAAYFVGINDAYLIRNCHDLGSLLAKAESYRTQWATDRQMNGTTARQLERTQANLNAAKEAAESIREEGRANAFL